MACGWGGLWAGSADAADGSETVLTQRRPARGIIVWLSDRDDHLGAGADLQRELVPATHGAKFRGGDGSRAIELVDRRVDPARRPLGLAGRGLRDLTGGDVAPAMPYPGASQRIR